MHESSNQERWLGLQKDDDGLSEELFQLLTVHAPGNAYSSDGSFAANLTQLPPGLRAMAATHCLDISLAIDSITWHFGNFGEPHLVAETEAGLRELALHYLAQCFVEAKELMQPLLAERTEADGDPYEILERAEFTYRADELDRQAWELGELGSGESAIYDARAKVRSAASRACVHHLSSCPEPPTVGEDKAKNNVCFCFALVVSCLSRFSTGARCIRRRAWR